MSNIPKIGPQTARDYFNMRVEAMSSEQSSWISDWKQLVRNFSPRSGRFTASDRNKGGRINTLINPIPLLAKRTLTSGLMTGITSPARPWFRLAPPDPAMADFGPVRFWLDEVERMIYKVFATSNLYKTLPKIYEENGVFGTAAMIQDEDFDSITRFSQFTIGEYMLDVNGESRVDTFARQYEETVYQMVSKFGLDNVSQSVKDNYDRGNYSVWVPVNHEIEPAGLADYESIQIPERFKWRSVYYEPGSSDVGDKFLRVKGYNDFPVHGPRWDAKTGDTYGYSPGMDALGGGKALQIKERELGKGISKLVAPPTVSPVDLQNKNLSLIAGANSFSDDAAQKFRAVYQIDPRVGELNNDIFRSEDHINRLFYVDLFLLISNQDDVRTATEIAARQEEKLLQLGPVLEGLHDELLDPLIDRTFNMLVRLSQPGWLGVGPQLLPPPPAELLGSDLKVEYISILAQAQKLVSTGATERWVGFTGQLASLAPEALDKLNVDEIVDSMAEDLGVPAKMVASEKEVQAKREARAEQVASQQRALQTQAMVESAKTLGDTPTTGGNVLNDVIGVG